MMKSPYEISDTEGEVINLLSGYPSKPSLLNAAKLLKKATDSFLNSELENGAKRLIYLQGADETIMLTTLAKFLSEQYQDEVNSSNLRFTGGATSAFVYLWTHLLRQNRKVIVAAPTYQLLLNSLVNDLKYHIESIPEDSEGIKLDEVENILKEEYSKHREKDEFSCGVYLVPTFSNPTSLLYSESFCKKVIQLVKKYNALIICDDVYNLLYGTEHPPRRLLSYETEETRGHVVSSGSFSKILSPALRLGWIEAHPPLIDRIKAWGIFQSANCLGQFSASIVTTAIESGDLTIHVTAERQILTERINLAKSILTEKMPSGVKVSPSLGGYFIWVDLPNTYSLDKIRKRCMERGVLFLPGSIHTNIDPGCKMRISVAPPSDINLLKQGLQTICDVVNQYKG